MRKRNAKNNAYYPNFVVTVNGHLLVLDTFTGFSQVFPDNLHHTTRNGKIHHSWYSKDEEVGDEMK